MTHEHTGRMHAEHRGPEHDIELPDATSIPEYPASAVARTLAPPLIDIAPLNRAPGTEYIGAEPGWWELSDPAKHGEIARQWLDDA